MSRMTDPVLTFVEKSLHFFMLDNFSWFLAVFLCAKRENLRVLGGNLSVSPCYNLYLAGRKIIYDANNLI